MGKFLWAAWRQGVAGGEGWERCAAGFTAAVGTALTLLLGGWDRPIRLLIGAMALDFFTGILGAVYQVRRGVGSGLDSEVMFWGGIRKGLVLLVVAVAVGVDWLLALPSPICRTAVIYYYIGREGISLTENMGVLGLPLPSFLQNLLAQLRDQGDEGKITLPGAPGEEKDHA